MTTAALPGHRGVALWLFADANTYLGTSGIMNRPNGMNNKGLLTGHRQPKLAWYTLCRFLKSLRRRAAADHSGLRRERYSAGEIPVSFLNALEKM